MRRSHQHVPAGAQIALPSCAVCSEATEHISGTYIAEGQTGLVLRSATGLVPSPLALVFLGSMNVSCLQRVPHLSYTIEFCAPVECRSIRSRRTTPVTRCTGPAAEEPEATSSGRPATHSAPQRGSGGPQKGLRVCCIIWSEDVGFEKPHGTEYKSQSEAQ